MNFPLSEIKVPASLEAADWFEGIHRRLAILFSNILDKECVTYRTRTHAMFSVPTEMPLFCGQRSSLAATSTEVRTVRFIGSLMMFYSFNICNTILEPHLTLSDLSPPTGPLPMP